jgi:hypothetical protein
MTKTGLKQLIKEVLKENQYERDFAKLMNEKYLEFKSAHKNTVDFAEEFAWRDGFKEGYIAAKNGH